MKACGEQWRKTESELAQKVLETARNQVLFALPYLEQALFFLRPVERADATTGSDGCRYYYDGSYLCSRFLQNPAEVECDYLHTVLHCLYRHPLQELRLYWDLATDIAVTVVMGEMNIPQIRTVIPERCFVIADQIREEVPLLSAPQIARYLRANEPDLILRHGIGLREMSVLFHRDNHSFWRSSRQNGQQSKESGQGDFRQNRQQWKEYNHSMEVAWQEIEEAVMQNAGNSTRGRADMPGCMMRELRRLTRKKQDYAEFLRLFAQPEECMKMNPDEFDYIYYAYGLSGLQHQTKLQNQPEQQKDLYTGRQQVRRQWMEPQKELQERWQTKGEQVAGQVSVRRIAMLEPLEYREESLIRDFIIAIDTSGSCSGNLVQQFLNRTYHILKSTENFSARVRIHIIQCDCDIQEDIRIEDLSQLEQYFAKMKIHGSGGTDFRPVFTYVDQLRAEHEFQKPGGLIYFTDGMGIFPKKPPGYKTAFVFVNRENEVQVPPWAMKLYL